MRRVLILFAIGALLVVSACASSSGISNLQGQWHRNNYGAGHEILDCSGSTAQVLCEYTTDPESNSGTFAGAVVDAEACPSYMKELCTSAVVIAQGTAQFTTGIVTDETIAVQADGSMMLSFDTPDVLPGAPFMCPWFRSYETALQEPYDCQES